MARFKCIGDYVLDMENNKTYSDVVVIYGLNSGVIAIGNDTNKTRSAFNIYKCAIRPFDTVMYIKIEKEMFSTDEICKILEYLTSKTSNYAEILEMLSVDTEEVKRICCRRVKR